MEEQRGETRSYRDRKCFHCNGAVNLRWTGEHGWVCVDTVRCSTVADSVRTSFFSKWEHVIKSM